MKEFFGSKLAYCKRFILKLVLINMIPIVNMLSNFFEAQPNFKFDFAKPRRKLYRSIPCERHFNKNIPHCSFITHRILYDENLCYPKRMLFNAEIEKKVNVSLSRKNPTIL